MNKRLLLIFTRNPELGKVKTRLAKTIGDAKALDIYHFLLEHTRQVTSKVNAEKRVCYSEDISQHDLWDSEEYQKVSQVGKDLGERMLNAFKQGFDDGYTSIVIIGSDLYDLETDRIEQAFLRLEDHDLVIGPAEDGGYYLLGMKENHPKLFSNKDWGTHTVLNKTLEDIPDKKVHLLDELNDIDTWEDIKNHPAFQHFF